MSQKPDPENSTLSDEELTLLHRVDERVESIDARVETAVDKAEDNADDIEQIRGKVRRNTTVVSGFTGGVSMVVLWAADKLSRFI